MHSLTDSNPQTLESTDWLDNILSVSCKFLFLITAERHKKAVINVDVVTRYYRVVTCQIHKFTYLLT